MKIVVIGCGAAGMMAAITAAEAGCDVTVLERNPFGGKKLRITGKGRCNVTNNCTPNEALAAVVSNPKFMIGALNRFTPADTMAFFESSGVELKTERGRRVFPASDRASDISDALLRRMREAGVTVRFDTRVTGISVTDGGYIVRWRGGEMTAERVIIATGGVSYPATGSTGDGHRMLSELGVSVTPLKPSLVPIETVESCAPMTGLTLKNVTLTVFHGEKRVFTEMGEMLFTHFGVSGPLVLSASSNMRDADIGRYRLSINLKPALSREELDHRLRSDFEKYAARDFVNSMGDLLPIKLIRFVIDRSGIDPRKKTANITKEERVKLGDTLTDLSLTPKAFRPVDEAIITSGGVDVREINPRTMELKSHPGIFVCGELIDVDAYTGGYNLQLAFSTAVAAGRAVSAVSDK